eukprot:TRINITY_DN7432_c0_g1_i1.p1 TRINITY_DN7432_c0_g1~~TRINITY_DN7432_c0_g1_i1.p1  ORF type:complete len:103 (-),score=18.44 TRINITY_DN7432_c0_g1_i1:46-354(-)
MEQKPGPSHWRTILAVDSLPKFLRRPRNLAIFGVLYTGLIIAALYAKEDMKKAERDYYIEEDRKQEERDRQKLEELREKDGKAKAMLTQLDNNQMYQPRFKK